MIDINKIIDKVAEEHPYRKLGHYSSQYNEGWQDACDKISRLIQAEEDSIIKKTIKVKKGEEMNRLILARNLTKDLGYLFEVVKINHSPPRSILDLPSAKSVAENGFTATLIIKTVSK